MDINLQTTLPTEIATTQTLTNSYADIGTEIDVRHYNKVGIWVTADVNNSEDVTIKALAKHTLNGADEYEIDGLSTISLWTTGASDFKKYYEFETGALNYLQLQVIAGTVGATAGTLSIQITKVNN